MTKPLTAEELADLVIPEINGYSLCSCDADTNRVCSFHECCARVIRQAQQEVLEKAMRIVEDYRKAETKTGNRVIASFISEDLRKLMEELNVEGGV